MKTKIFFIACLLFIAAIPFASYADDTDIYDTANKVKPNVLIIFDNSGSMLNSVLDDIGTTYDYTKTYSGPYDITKNYKQKCNSYWKKKCQDWDGWEEYTESFVDDNHNGIDDSNSHIKAGNRLNFDILKEQKKLDAAKDVVKTIIDDNKDNVRFGIMVLNGDIGGISDSSKDDAADVLAYHTDTTVLSSTYGGALIEDRTTTAQITALKEQIDNIDCDWEFDTPLANRLINAAQYFTHDFGSYADPIDATHWCRKNYVIIMTDGRPEVEGWRDSTGTWFFPHIEGFMTGKGVQPDYDGDSNDPGSGYINRGSDYLDDVAKYLYDTDIRPDIDTKQNITIYTIGFAIDHPLLQQTATNGGGEYYTAWSAEELSNALTKAMVSIIQKAQTFTAPVVPIQRTTSGDKMYLSLFTPKTEEGFWPGYLVKLDIGTNGELMGFSSVSNGLGTGSSVPVTTNGKLNEDILNPNKSPYPHWDAHYMLKQRDLDTRKIYTYTETNNSLTHDSNAFTTGNTVITAPMLGSPSDQPKHNPFYDAKENLMRYIRGWDSYDENGDNVFNEKRGEILGDILHSRPLIIDYENDPTDPHRVIYVGTNDGMLHAFDDTNGAEKWAFVPPDLLPKLKNIIESIHQYFVDSSPQAYIKDVDDDGNIDSGDDDQVIIVFGERGGGTSYTALDVTDPDEPKFLWKIDNTMTGFAAMGQTWSEPQIGKVKEGATDKVVAIIGGGNYEDDTAKGNAVYLVNIADGSLLKSFTVSDNAGMTYSIPSLVLAADTNLDDYIDRVYVGDIGGQMWRFGRHDGGKDDANIGTWTPRLLFQSDTNPTPKRKIYYPPDLVLEKGYEYLYFGTGDREDPMKLTTGAEGSGFYDRFYAVKDRNTATTLYESDDLVNLTDNPLQSNMSESDKEQVRADLKTKDGWYIIMEGDGEKVLASPVVIFGELLFTTFIPIDPEANPCSYGGDARLYAVDYLNGTAVLDLDKDHNIDKDDRTKVIGKGIPTEVVVTINADGTMKMYIATGDEIFLSEVNEGRKNFILNSWRDVIE